MNIFWRIVIAAIVVALLFAVLPPFFAILHVTPSAPILQIIEIAIVAGALFYVITGRSIPPVN